MPPVEEKRNQILEAAVEEFQQRGFAGASMDRIADLAQVSKRTVYNHFESKEALFNAIVGLMFEEARQTVDVQYRPGVPIHDQLVELGRAEGRLLQSERFMKLARMALGETMRAPEVAQAVQEEADKMSVFIDFMSAARADRAIVAEDLDDATQQFVALLKSKAFWPHVLRGGQICAKEMEAIIQSSVATFLARYGRDQD